MSAYDLDLQLFEMEWCRVNGIETVMHFGKYKNKLIRNVPWFYLRKCLLEYNLTNSTRRALEYERLRREPDGILATDLTPEFK